MWTGPALIVADERLNPHVQYASQLRQHQQAHVELASLQAGDERAIQIRRERKLLLTDALGPPRFAETCADPSQQPVGTFGRHAQMVAGAARDRLRDISAILPRLAARSVSSARRSKWPRAIGKEAES